MPNSESPFIRKLERLINSKITEETLSIDAICLDLNISRSQLHRKIKQETGLSTTLYFRKLKLIRAKELLQTTNNNISEIAYRVGISSPQNFSKYFTQEFGLSPKAYRLSDKSVIQESSDELKIEEITPSTDVKRFKFRWSMVVIAVGISLFFSISGYYRTNEITDGNYGITTFQNSIAILPLTSSSEVQTSTLSDGFAEDLLSQLSAVSDLKVISWASSLRYQDSKKSNHQIAKELGVSHIVTLDVQELGHEINIRVELIEAEKDKSIWTKEYQKDLVNYFTIQNELVADVLNILDQRPTQAVQARLIEIPTTSMEAYSDILVGRQLIKTRIQSDLEEGIKRFDNALARDSTYAEAYALKATAISLLGDMQYVTGTTYMDDVEEIALKSLYYDVNNAQAHAVLANLYVRQYKKNSAEIAYKTALKLQPNNALFNYWYALLLRTQNKIEMSLVYNKKAKLLDPFHPVIHAGYVATCVYGDRFEEAERCIIEDEKIFGDSFLYYWILGIFESGRGNYSIALEHYQNALDTNPGTMSIVNAINYCKGKLGMSEEVQFYMETIDTSSAIGFYRLAIAYAGLDEIEKATRYFVIAGEQGFVADVFLVSHVYRPFLKFPEIQKMLRDKQFMD